MTKINTPRRPPIKRFLAAIELGDIKLVERLIVKGAKLDGEYWNEPPASCAIRSGQTHTLNGTTQWPSAKDLRKFGETRTGATPAKARSILERIHEAIQDTAKDVRSYIKQHPEFEELGQRMLQEWEKGSATSLRS
jgi:hypothetical protein